MYSFDIWHKFDLYRYQVVLLVFIGLLGVSTKSNGQINGTLNLPYFDSQTMHYGFLIGMHSANYRLQYSDEFVEVGLDTLHSIVPRPGLGFRVGFIFDYHLHDILDIRTVLTVSFNQLILDYRFTDGTVHEELSDPTYVELPILLKYKSIRRKNRRMYVLAGINPAIKASGSREEEDKTEKLLINKFNLSVDVGAGFDIYQPLFKFSPEIRYSYGLINVLSDEPNDFSAGIKRLSIHTVTLYITFEGGPSELKRSRKR